MGPGGEEQKQNKRDDKWGSGPVAGARIALCLALFHKHFLVHCLWVQMDGCTSQQLPILLQGDRNGHFIHLLNEELHLIDQATIINNL